MFSTCLSVRSFVCHQTCERDILKTNEPILMPVGTSGPWGISMKCSFFRVRKSKVKCHTRPKIDLDAWQRHRSQPLGSSRFSIVSY